MYMRIVPRVCTLVLFINPEFNPGDKSALSRSFFYFRPEFVEHLSCKTIVPILKLSSQLHNCLAHFETEVQGFKLGAQHIAFLYVQCTSIVMVGPDKPVIPGQQLFRAC